MMDPTQMDPTQVEPRRWTRPRWTRPRLSLEERRRRRPPTNPAELPLYVTPAPELFRAFDGDLDALRYHLDRLVEEDRPHEVPLAARPRRSSSPELT